MLVDLIKDIEELLFKCKDVFEIMLNLIFNFYIVKIIKINFKINIIVFCWICKYLDGNYLGL